MTVATEACYAERQWTGVETSFAAGFTAQHASHIALSYRNSLNVVTPLTQGLHAQVMFGVGGEVIVVPLALPPAPGEVLIERVTPALQATNFTDLAKYSAATHERLHDAAAMRAAELKRKLAIMQAVDPLSVGPAGNNLFTQLIESVKTDDYVVTLGDRGRAIIGNKVSPIYFDLPPAAACNEFVFWFRNIGDGDLILRPNGTDSFEGNSTYAIPKGAYALCVSNGTTWRAAAMPYVSPVPLPVDRGGTGAVTPRAAMAALKGVHILHCDGSLITFTGAATIQTMKTITVPGGAMGPHGQLRVTFLFGFSAGTPAPFIRLRFGGVSGALYAEQFGSSVAMTGQWQVRISNRGVVNSQIGMATATVFNVSNGSDVTSSLNTNNDQDLVFQGGLLNAAHSVFLKNVLVELMVP